MTEEELAALEQDFLEFEATQENEPEDEIDSEDEEWAERLRDRYLYTSGSAPAGYRPQTGLRHGVRIG